MPLKFDKKFDKGNVIKNLAQKHKLVTHIDRALADFTDEFEFKYEDKKTDDGWHPSGDCIPCVSDLFWKVKEPTPKNISVSLQKTFLVGHYWHQLLQYIVLEKLRFCESADIERRGIRAWGPEDSKNLRNVDSMGPIPWLPYHYATGSGDIAPCHVPEYGDYIVDFKTMNSRDYNNNGVPSWCAEKYEAQIQIYMDFFDVEQGMIVAVQKDSPHSFKEFEYRRNQPLIDRIYDKWEFVAEALTQDYEPDVDDDEAFTLQGLFTGPIEA